MIQDTLIIYFIRIYSLIIFSLKVLYLEIKPEITGHNKCTVSQ